MKPVTMWAVVDFDDDSFIHEAHPSIALAQDALLQKYNLIDYSYKVKPILVTLEEKEKGE